MMVEGNPDSKVRVVAFEDLQCPDCADYRVMLDRQLLPKYAGRVAFEHRHFPLPKHRWARKAAVAVQAFDEIRPELGIAFAGFCLANLRTIRLESFDERLSEFAREQHADGAAVLARMQDPAIDDAVERDYQDGIARGVTHTPTVLVNGTPFVETFTYEEISEGIEKALQETESH